MDQIKAFISHSSDDALYVDVLINLIGKNSLVVVFINILSLIIIIHAVVLPLILGVVCFTSYHLLRSAAFALCFIPKSS